ncbi:MAG: 1,4-dihydroxy-6-naphthoate synthase [Bacteroidota bacterium]
MTIGFSPCPNDTFIFDALVHGRIDLEGLTFEPILADVEELNRMAANGELDVTKLSYHAFGHLSKQYKLLNAGSALGRGVGPLLVSTKSMSSEEIAHSKIAIPGNWTTANFLLGIAYPKAQNKTEVLFSDIEDAVLSGEYDAGLLIHENRFTYEQRGLIKLADLGEFWEQSTGRPIPLGGIAVKRDRPAEVQKKIDRLVKKSLEYAYQNPEAALPYIREHAQAMDLKVMQAHIDLYVNQYSLDLGDEGREAVQHLLSKGRELQLIPDGPSDLFI